MTLELPEAAVAYAQDQGAQVIEGFPMEFGGNYRRMGSPTIYELAGFREIERPVHGRSLMRYVAGAGEQSGAEGGEP